MLLITTWAISAPVSITRDPIAPNPLKSPLTVAPILMGLMGMGGLVKNVLNGTKPGMGDGLLVLANGLVLELNGGLVVMICVLVAG